MTHRPQKPSIARNRIALVDDDEDMRTLLRHSLELRGYEVLEFESTEQALGWSKASKSVIDPPLAQADLLILDINLPGLSGIETIQIMKESPKLRRIPIAMLTAHKEADVVLKCIRAGASDYFVKPLDFPEVMRRIEKLLSDPTKTLAKTAQVPITWNFQELLVREIKRSERSNLPLGLVVGGVRKLSTLHIELTADQIEDIWSNVPETGRDLRKVVESFVLSYRRKAREYDILIPFGTGEFAAILPDTPPVGIESVVKRMFQVFQQETDLPPLSRQERWGLLVGWAEYPTDGADNLGLFSTAESALSDQPPERGAGQGEDSQLFRKTVRCPGCAKHFSYPKIGVRRLSPIGRESDLRLLFEDLDPLYYGAVACPSCGLGALEPDFKFLRKLEPPFFGWNYETHPREATLTRPSQTLIPEELQSHLSPPYEAWLESSTAGAGNVIDLLSRHQPPAALLNSVALSDSLRLSPDQALARHLLADETYRAAGASPLRRARLAHRIAWFFRIKKQNEPEVRYLSKALDLYLTAYHFEDLTDSKPSDLEILYLLGELSFRLNREREAVAIFDHLSRDPRLESKPAFKKMVHRRWYEARHETPPVGEEDGSSPVSP